MSPRDPCDLSEDEDWEDETPLLVYEPGEEAGEPRPLILPSDVQAVEFEKVKDWPVRWVWEPYLPVGYLSLLLGEPGAGKTWAALSIAAMLSRGEGLPGKKITSPPPLRSSPSPLTERGPGGEVSPAFPLRVLYVTGEDRGPGLRARLKCLGADLSNVYFFQDDPGRPFTLADLTPLAYAMQQIRPALVVLDPFQAFWGKGGGLGQAEQMRRVLSPLAQQAWGYECAVLLVGHLTKRDPGRSIHRGLGSVDLAAAARSVLMVGRAEKAEPSRSEPLQQVSRTGEARAAAPLRPELSGIFDGRAGPARVLVHVKSCYAPEGAALKFAIEDAGVRWLGASRLTAADVAAREETGYKLTLREEARALLKDLLKNGPVPLEELHKRRLAEGIGKTTFYDARNDLGITADRRGGEAVWVPPVSFSWDTRASGNSGNWGR